MPEISKIQVSGVEYDLKANLPLITIAASQVTSVDDVLIIDFTAEQTALLRDDTSSEYKFDVSAIGMYVGYMKKDFDTGRAIGFCSFGETLNPPYLIKLICEPKPSAEINDTTYQGKLYSISLQKSLPTVVNDRFLHTNASTGALEWTDLVVSNTAAVQLTVTSATQYTVTHNLNSRNILVQIYDMTTYETIVADVTRDTVNTVKIEFNTVPSHNCMVLFTGMNMVNISSGEEVKY